MNPYLNFSGNCKQAFDAYQTIFGARLLFSHTWGESPMAADAPGGKADAIMHATLQFPDGALLMGLTARRNNASRSRACRCR